MEVRTRSLEKGSGYPFIVAILIIGAPVLPPLEITTSTAATMTTEDSESTVDSDTEPVSTTDTGPGATTPSLNNQFVAVFAGVAAGVIVLIIATLLVLCVILFVCCSEKK